MNRLLICLPQHPNTSLLPYREQGGANLFVVIPVQFTAGPNAPPFLPTCQIASFRELVGATQIEVWVGGGALQFFAEQFLEKRAPEWLECCFTLSRLAGSGAP